MTTLGYLRALAALTAIALLLPTGGRTQDASAASVSNENSKFVADSNFVKQTFTYKTVGNLAIKADVYRLAGDDLRPVIVWIHGGALIFGSRETLPEDERQQLLQAGYVIVAIDYRLAPEAKLPEIVKDVEDAHRWVRDKGPTLFRIDPDRMAVVGQVRRCVFGTHGWRPSAASPERLWSRSTGTVTLPEDGTAVRTLFPSGNPE